MLDAEHIHETHIQPYNRGRVYAVRVSIILSKINLYHYQELFNRF